MGYNQVEQARFRLGFKTNASFSQNWQIKTYLAYGTKDEKFKYGLGVDHILSKRKWTTIGASYKNDYDILGVTDNSGSALQGTGTSNIFAALSLASPQARINHTIDYRINFTIQPKRDWTFQTTLQNTYFDALGKRPYFYYKTNPDLATTPDNLEKNFLYTAATIEARYAYKELMIVRGLERTRLVRAKAPVVALSYTHGFKNILGGQFNFDKVQLNLNQHISTGVFGNADYNITVGKIFGTLPYPILDVSKGNQTFLYAENNYSLMNLYEFVADEYIHVNYVQHFEGLFTNRVPLLKKWKLRNFAVVKTAYGHLSQENRNLYPEKDKNGMPLTELNTFANDPYVEVGYGFENIFRFFTIGSFHRLTYTQIDNQQYFERKRIRTWGINLGVRFTF